MAEWNSIVANADLRMTCAEIRRCVQAVQAEATKRGEVTYFKTEVTAAIEAFISDPNPDTASRLLDAAPPLRRYFEACSPGNDFYENNRLLDELK
jgi:hypothetical protein